MNIVSLFSGIGGFEKGIKKIDIDSKIVFSSEIDHFAAQSYKFSFNQEPFGDITKIHEFLIPDHDLLTAGFPCQSFSIAGKREGFSDTRGTLFFDIARILDFKKPKYILLENVKNLVSHDRGATIETILYTLNQIGYTLDFNVYNSMYFDVPQSRERTYIVGVLNGKTEDYKVNTSSRIDRLKLKLNEDKTFNKFNLEVDMKTTPKYILEDILEDNVDERYFYPTIIPEQIVPEKELLKGLKSPRQPDKIVKIFDIPKEVWNDQERQRRVYSVKGLAPTVLARSDAAKLLVSHKGNLMIRKLTPLEAFRLQGFDDDFFNNLRNHGMSDTQLYKQAGNAVTTNVVSAIVKKLIKFN